MSLFIDELIMKSYLSQFTSQSCFLVIVPKSHSSIDPLNQNYLKMLFHIFLMWFQIWN